MQTKPLNITCGIVSYYLAGGWSASEALSVAGSGHCDWTEWTRFDQACFSALGTAPKY